MISTILVKTIYLDSLILEVFVAADRSCHWQQVTPLIYYYSVSITVSVLRPLLSDLQRLSKL